MFNTISWQGYWTFIGLALLGYYLSIYLLFFRRRRDLRLTRSVDNFFSGSNSIENKRSDSSMDIADQGAESCIDEINAFFDEARRTKATKQELVFALQRLLGKYSHIKNSKNHEALSNLIKTLSEQICSVHLSDADMVQVWITR